MSKPSFSNIELWLFELAEGNLSPRQIEQLELFLLQNPELDVDRDVWEMAKVAKQSVAYPEQEKLLKKRPVGWYIGGGVAATSVIALLWYLVPQFIGQNELLARNTDRTEVRVFVINKDQNLLDQQNMAGAVLAAQLEDGHQNASDINVPAEHGPNPIEQRPTGQHQEIVNVQHVEQEGADATNGAEGSHTDGLAIAQVNANSNPENTMLIADPANAGSETNASAANLALGGVDVQTMMGEVNALPVVEPASFYFTADLDLLPMRLSREQLIYQEDALAHHFDERETNFENENAQPANTHQTFSSGYHASLKTRLSAFGRKIQRMMDNPVALKNFKDPHFHVPGMLPNDINFSSTGTMLSARVQTLSRIQWMGQENEQLINQLAFDGYAYAVRGGVGLQINHGMYRDGGISVASAAITYSPKISISRKISVEPSIRFKMGNKTLANSKMQGVDQVEIDRGNNLAYYPESEPIGKMLWYQDLGAGLMVNTEWFFAGVQLDNLFRHYDNIYDVNIESARRSPNHFVATVGTDWVSKRENLSLSPYIVYQNYGQLSEAWAGLNFRLAWFTMGASVSSSLEPAASVGLKFDHFALTYNADYTKSVMTGAPSLSHQLTLRFVSKPSRFGKRLLNL